MTDTSQLHAMEDTRPRSATGRRGQRCDAALLDLLEADAHRLNPLEDVVAYQRAPPPREEQVRSYRKRMVPAPITSSTVNLSCDWLLNPSALATPMDESLTIADDQVDACATAMDVWHRLLRGTSLSSARKKPAARAKAKKK